MINEPSTGPFWYDFEDCQLNKGYPPHFLKDQVFIGKVIKLNYMFYIVFGCNLWLGNYPEARQKILDTFNLPEDSTIFQ